MTDHRLAWVPRRYTCTAVPRRMHTERPLSALVRVITRASEAGAPPWHMPACPAPGGGGGDGELAGGGREPAGGATRGRGAAPGGAPPGPPGLAPPRGPSPRRQSPAAGGPRRPPA